MEEPGTVSRILIIRFSSIGDIVLTTPVVRILKEQLPGGVEIHFLTKKKFASLLEANPHITKIHTIERTVQEALPELEKIGFDYIIDLHRNIRSSVVKRRLKSLAFTFKKLNFQKWLWVNLGINRMPDVHIVDRYLDTIKAFQLKDDGKGLDYFIPANTPSWKNELSVNIDSPFVAFAIGGMHIGKKMSREKIAAICKEVKYPVILLGGKEDSEEGDFIVSGSGSHVVNAAGKFSLHQSAMCLKDSSIVISGDTGMMHIASAFGKKIISLWGCTVPGLGMSPYRPHPSSVILEPQGRNKRPCSKLGNKCKYGEGEKRCIEQISVNTVTDHIHQLMK